MMGLNIEQIVRFQHNTFQTVEGSVGGVYCGTETLLIVITCFEQYYSLPSFVLFQAKNVSKPFWPGLRPDPSGGGSLQRSPYP